MNIITKMSLIIGSALLSGMYNTLQPSDYILNAEFKEYPKYIKSVDKIPVSSLHVKDRSLCSNFCDESFKGEIFAGGDGSKRLRSFHEDNYSTSLWDIQFTSNKETTNTALGIIYNETTMLQITDDKSLWLSLIDQLKNKNLKDKEPTNTELKGEEPTSQELIEIE